MFRPQNLCDKWINQIFENSSTKIFADFVMQDLSDEQTIKKLADGIAKNTYLTSINFTNSSLDEAHIDLLAKAILKNNTLTSVTLQKFDDYSDDTKKHIDTIEKHVATNLARKNSPVLTSTPAGRAG